MRLSKFVVIFSLLCGEAQASSQDEAIKTVMLASYKQSGMEEHVTKAIEKNVPKKYRTIIGHLGNIINIGINQKVELNWTF